MKKIISWITSLLSDEQGAASSKRFIGIICALTVCVCFVLCSCDKAKAPPDYFIWSMVTIITFCFGATTVDKFSVKSVGENQKS